MTLNKVSLIGEVARAPEVRSFGNGGRVASLRLKTTESWKDKASGERKYKDEYHSIQVFSEGLIGVAEKHISEGDQLYIEGKLETRKWQDKDGKDRYSTEVVLRGYDASIKFLRGGSGPKKEPSHQSDGFGGSARPDLDDEIPF